MVKPSVAKFFKLITRTVDENYLEKLLEQFWGQMLQYNWFDGHSKCLEPTFWGPDWAFVGVER
jgi:hypothetical protein